MSVVDDLLLQDAAFSEIPGLRGLKVARLGQRDGKTLEVIEAAKGVVIPAMTHPSGESGRVLQGSLRFTRAGIMDVMHAGATWRVEANQSQGPHVSLEDGTRVAILRDGKSAFDP